MSCPLVTGALVCQATNSNTTQITCFKRTMQRSLFSCLKASCMRMVQSSDGFLEQ